MILELTRTEDDISIEERDRILEEVTKDKKRGYVNYAALKDDCARKKGYSNWKEYQKVLIRKYRERIKQRKTNRLYVFFVKAGKIHPEKLEKYLACGLF